MLKFWRSHADYHSFVSDTVSSFSETELLKLQSYSTSKNKKPSQKPGKGKKLPNRHSGITEKIASHIRLEKNFPFYYEELL